MCAHDSYVRPTLYIVPDPLKGPFLEKPQELRLKPRGDILDLVEKQCAFVRQFEPPDTSLCAPR